MGVTTMTRSGEHVGLVEQLTTYQWLAYFGNTTGPLTVPDLSTVWSIIFSLWTTDRLGSLVQSKIGPVW